MMSSTIPPRFSGSVLDTLVRCYGVQAKSPLGINVTNWYHEPFISGCHGFAQLGVLRDCGEALRDPIGPIHWAGTDTADVWINHMDGAVQAGERAAGEVANRPNRSASTESCHDRLGGRDVEERNDNAVGGAGTLAGTLPAMLSSVPAKWPTSLSSSISPIHLGR